MAATFTHPPHPSELATTKTSLRPNGEPSNASQRDPHDVPTFTDSGIVHPDEPILFLPPLLSSLPPRFDNEAADASILSTETRLPDIDPASLSLHKALHKFRPVSAAYASLPYAEAFNWNALRLPEEHDREWYCVVFRSKRKSGSDGTPLYDADRLAHEEAVRNGGLILYWYGIPDPKTGMNLATCVWQSRRHAVAANSRPHHVQAMRLAAGSYEVYNLERHVLSKRRGETGVSIEPYSGGEVGW